MSIPRHPYAPTRSQTQRVSETTHHWPSPPHPHQMFLLHLILCHMHFKGCHLFCTSPLDSPFLRIAVAIKNRVDMLVWKYPARQSISSPLSCTPTRSVNPVDSFIKHRVSPVCVCVCWYVCVLVCVCVCWYVCVHVPVRCMDNTRATCRSCYSTMLLPS